MTRLSLNVEEYVQCIQNLTRELYPSKTWIEQYLSCLDHNCDEINNVEEDTKQVFANKLLSCVSQCSTSKQPDFQQFEKEESSGDTTEFQLNTFLIAISVILGVIILFVALVKWASIRKNRINMSKFSMKVSPQMTTTAQTNMYPVIQLTTCNNALQTPKKTPVQGLPCKEDELDKLSIFKAIPGAQKIKPSSIIFNEEKYSKPKDIYYPGKSVETIQDKQSTDKKIDIPTTLLITQIQINDSKDNQGTFDDYNKISLQENLSPFTPINQITNLQNKNNIHLKRLNISKISKTNKLSESSTLTFLTKNSRDNQLTTSRCDLQNYLIDKSPINNIKQNTQLTFRQQQILNKQKGFHHQENKRPVSSKSLPRHTNNNNTNQHLKNNNTKRRKSFDCN